uniref:Putative secreted protein n=1 Tax=Anopheles triannulatus TaxID=58253 RepID=A0A2M4B4T1_9DIPT
MCIAVLWTSGTARTKCAHITVASLWLSVHSGASGKSVQPGHRSFESEWNCAETSWDQVQRRHCYGEMAARHHPVLLIKQTGPLPPIGLLRELSSCLPGSRRFKLTNVAIVSTIILTPQAGEAG